MGKERSARNYKSRGPELLNDLKDKASAILREVAGLDSSAAARVSEELTVRMAADWGGQVLYFPKGSIFKLTDRDWEIYAEFNGANHAELAKRYDLCVQRIYEIVKHVKQEEFARRQRDLFPSGEGEK